MNELHLKILISSRGLVKTSPGCDGGSTPSFDQTATSTRCSQSTLRSRSRKSIYSKSRSSVERASRSRPRGGVFFSYMSYVAVTC